MREKELRLALICYGGVSLAIYMHGVTKEIWRLARASRCMYNRELPISAAEAAYQKLFTLIETETATRLRVLPDIIAGASAGGINGIFLPSVVSNDQFFSVNSSG